MFYIVIFSKRNIILPRTAAIHSGLYKQTFTMCKNVSKPNILDMPLARAYSFFFDLGMMWRHAQLFRLTIREYAASVE